MREGPRLAARSSLRAAGDQWFWRHQEQFFGRGPDRNKDERQKCKKSPELEAKHIAQRTNINNVS